MTTVVNNPAPVASSAPAQNSGGTGLIIGAVVLVGFIILVLYIGLPAIRRMSEPVQVNVPDKIDVNVTQ